MPNEANITQPTLVIGPGRTASSYLLHILKLRGDVQTLIENEVVMKLDDLVRRSWWSRYWSSVCSDEVLRERVVQAARQVMITLFPSDLTRWAYKAIWEDIDWDFYAEVYPEARYVHLVRDPRTNIKSMMDFIAQDGGQAHWTLEYSATKYLDSNRKALDVASRNVPYLLIRQEDLVAHPRVTWRTIFEFLDLEYMDLPYDQEINVSRGTRGRVRALRADSALAWDDLPEEVRRMAALIGYDHG